jgi:hypothetical protein
VARCQRLLLVKSSVRVEGGDPPARDGVGRRGKWAAAPQRASPSLTGGPVRMCGPLSAAAAGRTSVRVREGGPVCAGLGENGGTPNRGRPLSLLRLPRSAPHAARGACGCEIRPASPEQWPPHPSCLRDALQRRHAPTL